MKCDKCFFCTHIGKGRQWYAESWIQINIFGMCICLSKRKIKIER